MVGCELYAKKMKRDWLSILLCSKFFGPCNDHKELRKNEKNVFCIDCGCCCCRHCISSSTHWLHRSIQICKYVYQDVIRFQDVHRHHDCSQIQTYKINGEKAVHLNPRPQSKDFKPSKSKGGTFCEACGRYIQEHPNRFCSIACKVSVVGLESRDQSHKIIPLPISEFSDLYLKGSFSSEDNLKEREPSISLGSSSEETQAFVGYALRAKKHLHKRKGIPRRAPLC